MIGFGLWLFLVRWCLYLDLIMYFLPFKHFVEYLDTFLTSIRPSTDLWWWSQYSFFFQNYFLLHWCIVIIHILLARSINQFRNNGFEFSRNFDQFPCFNIAHLTISTIFLTKVNHLSLFSLNEVKLLMLICFLMYDFFIHFLLFWTTISNFLCNLVLFF